MLQEEDWNRFSNEEKLPITTSKKIWNTIYKKTFYKKYLWNKTYKIVAVAAILLLVTSIGHLTFEGRDTRPSKEVLFSLTNNSTKDVVAYLPDSSKIRLFPHSVVKYYYNSDLKQREVMLSGKAVFDVFKDKEHPFYVRTERIEVRAVGTIFLIDENQYNKNVNVKLIEGKIIVKDIPQKTGRLVIPRRIEEHLVAGESLSYQPEHLSAPVTKLKVSYASNLKALDIQGKDFLCQFVDNNYLEFKNEKLSRVFEVLGSVYQNHIQYPQHLLENFSLTATFKTTDSLDEILNKITKINHLKYTQKDQQVNIFF